MDKNLNLNGANILITGGTGSFGKAFTKFLLNEYDVNKIVILSRDEMKQWKMQNELVSDKIRYLLGDVRDVDRLEMAFRDIDFVVHAAATKIVMSAEYNPFECIKTNVFGAMNVIQASLKTNVQKVIALSTDKASSPINLYGASKLCSDKLFVSANNYSGVNACQFSVVRYGNVLGSRGSVIPLFLGQKNNIALPITHPAMTRFIITMNDAIRLVLEALNEDLGGAIFVKKIPSATIDTIAEACKPGCSKKIIGIRPGEKIHEQMISSEDAHYTREYNNFYKILPNINEWYKDPKRILDGKPVAEDFVYSSENNPHFLTIEELKQLINIHRKSFESL